jgi:diguanylate cyclase (GGDEF)-like protein
MNELSCLKKFFENSPKCISIVDLDTDQIVYLNRIGCRRYHFDYDQKEYLSRRAADVLPYSGMKTPDLKEDQFIEKDYIDEKNGCYLQLSISMFVCDGRKYHILQEADEYHSFQNRKRLGTIRSNEVIIDGALELAMNEEDPDRSIQGLLKYIGEHLNADRAYIFEMKPDGHFANTYEWCGRGIESEKDRLQDLPYTDVVEHWYEEFDRQRNIVIQDVDQYQCLSEKIQDLLAGQDIHQLVVGPLTINHKRVGFYGVNNPSLDQVADISVLYDVLGRFLASMLRHRDNDRKIYRDELTGVMNRAYLSHYLETGRTTDSMTLYFCDINGLKQVNDNDGHTAGDEMIRRMASALTGFAGSHPVIRMGGDEFLLVYYGLDEAQSLAREEELHRYLCERGISAAVGRVWYPDRNVSFASLFQEADRRMYSNKEQMHRMYR